MRVAGGDGNSLLGAVAPGEPQRVALLDDADPLELLRPGALARSAGRARNEIELRDPETLEPVAPWRLLLPLDPPEVWASGVTYERSRDARLGESRSETRDAYSLVYEAERPELFMKDAGGRRTVGPGGRVGVRSDSSWNVPEPEVGLIVGAGGELLGATIGNDVSSRDIEGANPLYLPQAKIYAGACALGPAVLVPDDWEEPFELDLRVLASDGTVAFEGSTSTARMRRSFAELASFLVRDNPVPAGSVLLTGTGLVPPDEFTLEPGQRVEIRIGGIGTLVNDVARAADLL